MFFKITLIANKEMLAGIPPIMTDTLLEFCNYSFDFV
jgi:hypothetical protein